ncbi:bactofilin family protein [Halomonas sp. A29]|uniref:bactofilin family protein n=1 Tax=Halomonas sp. A29 TaxID=3102786 RepID=UPI00398B9192
MTLIVWDGGRRKRKRLAAGLVESMTTVAPAFHSEAFPVIPRETQRVETTISETQPAARLPSETEGSRIGVATRVSGKLIANEPVVIKGSIEGALIAQEHPVMVTMSGRVSSYLEGREISVDGQVVGKVKASDKLTLRSRARILGIVEAKRLECHAGAHIQGEVASSAAG